MGYYTNTRSFTAAEMKMVKRRQRSERGRRTALKEAVILIPLTYNDGAKVPRRIFHSIRDEVLAAFGGWTVEGTVKGAYRMRSGEKIVEDLERVSIMLPESRLADLEGM